MSTQKSKMFEIRPGQHRPKLFRNGALFFLFLALCTYIMYFRPPVPLLSQTGYEVEADLAEATNIRPGFTPVRVSGINVGQVTKKTELGPGNGFRITMEFEKGMGIKKGGVFKDATANSRWRTLLGRNHYIELDPGSPSKGEISGPIPVSATGGQIELDEAIDSFDKTGRDSLSTMISEFNKGFSKPEDVRGTVDAVAPAMRNIAPALDALQGNRQGALSTTVKQTSRAMGALARDERALGGLVDSGAVALGVTAARRADIGATLRTAPAALRQTRSTMVRLRTTLDELDPLAEELRPGARVLDDAAVSTRAMLTRATPLLEDARPTLRDLAPAARSARSAARSGAPAVENFQPILDTFKDTLIPFFDREHPESKRKNFQMIGPTLSAAAALTALGDRRGSNATFHAGFGEGAYSSLSPCRTDLFDKYTRRAEGAIKCELLANILTGNYEGADGFRVNRFGSRTVPDDILGKLLGGKLSLKGAIGQLESQLKDTVSKVKVGSKRGGR